MADESTKSTTSRVEDILANILGRMEDMPTPGSRIEQLLIDLAKAIEAGGTEDAKLADAIDVNSKNIEALQASDTLLALAVAGKIDISDIVVLTRSEYDALSEKTALEYHIIEE